MSELRQVHKYDGETYFTYRYMSGNKKEVANDGTKTYGWVFVIPLQSIDLSILLDLCTLLGSQIVQGPKFDSKKDNNATAGPGGSSNTQISREKGSACAKQIDAVEQRYG